MKKIILLVIMLIAAMCFNLFAASAWLSPYPAGFNVDLEDPYNVFIGAANGSLDIDGKGIAKDFQQSGNNGYTPETMVCLIGVKEVPEGYNAKITITVNSFSSNSDYSWAYVSASEPYIRRPFALDFVSCYYGKNGARTVQRLGYGGDSSRNTISIDLDMIKNNVTEAWVDVILYLPKDGVDLSYALSAHDYYCNFDISVDLVAGDGSSTYVDSWSMSFNGYVNEKPETGEKPIVFFNVTPSPEAYAIDIDNQMNDLLSTSGIQIGTFSLETQAFMDSGYNDIPENVKYTYQKGNMYSIFASSSDDPFNKQGDKFKLILDGLESYTDLADSYQFEYEVGLAKNNNDTPVWYDGTMSVGEGQNITSTKSNNNSSLLNSADVTQSMGDNHQGYSLFFHIDDGPIYIRAAQGVNGVTRTQLENLTAGVYSSKIYFHVVSKY